MTRSGEATRLGAGSHGLALAVLVALVCANVLVGGCSRHKKQPLAAPPPPTFTGPEFLQGTVQSLATMRGYRPLLVSMWGVVGNLRQTGSADVPAFLRNWLFNEMRRRGVGSYRLGTQDQPPAVLLASNTMAVVRVEGLIPPGALVGSRFDVLVTALPGTQTTSLQGGRLWTTDLSVGGANTRLLFSHKLAEAAGDLYIDPFKDPEAEKERAELLRRAVVLGGGKVTTERPIEIVLNQPNGQRAQLIADRISERFPHERAAEFFNTAVAKNDMLVELHVPARYAHETTRFLELVGKLYLDRDEQAQRRQAQRLIEVARSDPRYAADAALGLEGLGKTVIPQLRPLYGADPMHLRLAVVEAGARLGDIQAADALLALAGRQEAAVRKRAAELMVALPVEARVTEALLKLVDDADREVRLAAYETMAQTANPALRRTPVSGSGGVKFLLDLVPSKRPLVYVAHHRLPRVAVFGLDTGFKTPLLARLWDNRLMVRSAPGKSLLDVFYQPVGEAQAQTFEIAASIANFVILLGQQPTVRNERQGLDLTFSEVVNALFELKEAGQIDAEVDIRLAALEQTVAPYRRMEPTMRPENEADGVTAAATQDVGRIAGQ